MTNIAVYCASSNALGPEYFASARELGLLMAALTALGAGGNPLYLGLELPVEDLLTAVEATNASRWLR